MTALVAPHRLTGRLLMDSFLSREVEPTVWVGVRLGYKARASRCAVSMTFDGPMASIRKPVAHCSHP